MWRQGMIPDKTANFNVYSGTAAKTNRLAGVSEEFKCPELEFVTETLKMAGFAGEFDSPAIGQLKNMEVEIKFTGLSKDGLTLPPTNSISVPLFSKTGWNMLKVFIGEIFRKRTPEDIKLATKMKDIKENSKYYI